MADDACEIVLEGADRGTPKEEMHPLPSRYANRTESRFEFLLPSIGQSPKGDTLLNVVLLFVANPKLRISGSDFAAGRC